MKKITDITWSIEGSTHTHVDENGYVNVDEDEDKAYCFLKAELDGNVTRSVISNADIPLKLVSPAIIAGNRGQRIELKFNKPVKWFNCDSEYSQVIYVKDHPLNPLLEIGELESHSTFSITCKLDTETIEIQARCNNPKFVIIPSSKVLKDNENFTFETSYNGNVEWNISDKTSTETVVTNGNVHIGWDEVYSGDRTKKCLLTATIPETGAIAHAVITVEWTPCLSKSELSLEGSEYGIIFSNCPVEWDINPTEHVTTYITNYGIYLDFDYSADGNYVLTAYNDGSEIHATIHLTHKFIILPSQAILSCNSNLTFSLSIPDVSVTWTTENPFHSNESSLDNGYLHLAWNEATDKNPQETIKLIVTPDDPEYNMSFAIVTVNYKFCANIEEILIARNEDKIFFVNGTCEPKLEGTTLSTVSLEEVDDYYKLTLHADENETATEFKVILENGTETIEIPVTVTEVKE